LKSKISIKILYRKHLVENLISTVLIIIIGLPFSSHFLIELILNPTDDVF